MMTTCAAVGTRPLRRLPVRREYEPSGLRWLLAAESVGGVGGFFVTVHWARSLGPLAFAHVEYAAAVAAWLLVVVRGGIELIVYREAARHPRLVHPLTELLLGLKCACAILGYALMALVAWIVGQERGHVVAVAGLVLLPSAFVADVGPRAGVRLGWIALAQLLRVAGYATAGFSLVRDPSHAIRAACCIVLAEAVVWLVFFALHVRVYGAPRPRWRRRAWAVLAYRGAIASLIRFGRVSLYGADLLVLGWWAGSELGPYASARRVVFALVALGLVVPGAMSPAIARAWREGEASARRLVSQVSAGLWRLALPASLGLVITAPRWMPLLFGPSYGVGAQWLALVALRLPWLLSASLSQSALVACRRETDALRLVLGMALAALALMPISTACFGPRGAASAVLVVEMTGAIGGWLLLRRLEVAPFWHEHSAGTLVGCLVMGAVCALTYSGPVWAVCLAGAASYAGTLWICSGLIPLAVAPRGSNA